jgi:hypothetical protein
MKRRVSDDTATYTAMRFFRRHEPFSIGCVECPLRGALAAMTFLEAPLPREVPLRADFGGP